MSLLRKIAQITNHETRDHQEGGTYEFYEGVIPGRGSFEVKERNGWFSARANDDDSTIQVRMDEGGLVGWFQRTFGRR